jgi:hypothetical protein
LINKTRHEIEQAIEKFFYNRQREDLLLLYFSGHGLKSKSGQLYLAAQNTTIDLLRSTGISASFVKENMEGSNSQRQVLILDCCYGGAIVEGAKGDNVVGQTIDSLMPFKSANLCNMPLTASILKEIRKILPLRSILSRGSAPGKQIRISMAWSV